MSYHLLVRLCVFCPHWPPLRHNLSHWVPSLCPGNHIGCLWSCPEPPVMRFLNSISISSFLSLPVHCQSLLCPFEETKEAQVNCMGLCEAVSRPSQSCTTFNNESFHSAMLESNYGYQEALVS